jgi:hypothetical protein
MKSCSESGLTRLLPKICRDMLRGYLRRSTSRERNERGKMKAMPRKVMLMERKPPRMGVAEATPETRQSSWSARARGGATCTRARQRSRQASRGQAQPNRGQRSSRGDLSARRPSLVAKEETPAELEVREEVLGPTVEDVGGAAQGCAKRGGNEVSLERWKRPRGCAR